MLRLRAGGALLRHMELRSFFILFLCAGTLLAVLPLLHDTLPISTAFSYGYFYAISFLSTNGLMLQEEVFP